MHTKESYPNKIHHLPSIHIWLVCIFYIPIYLVSFKNKTKFMRGRHLKSLSYITTPETKFPVHKLWRPLSNNIHTIVVRPNQYRQTCTRQSHDNPLNSQYLIYQPYESICLLHTANPLIAWLGQGHNKIISPHQEKGESEYILSSLRWNRVSL